MTSEVDRKTYWDLPETIRWICTRDEQLVAAVRDMSFEDKMAEALWGMKVPRVIHSRPGPSGTNRGADLEAPALQGDAAASHPLDDSLAKVRSGRVRMTAIRCDKCSNEQIPVPLAELNDLEIRITPGHPVAPAGLWSRSRGTLVWRSPQFLRVDAVRAWPAPSTKRATVFTAVLRHLREIMSPEAPLTKLEAQRRCMAEVPNAYRAAFGKAWAELDPSCKRGRGKHGLRGR